MRRARRNGKGPRIRQAVVLSLCLALSLCGGGAAVAQEEPASPQLPVLLLNGAVYPDGERQAAIPAAFRVDGYPADAPALYILRCAEPVKTAWLDELRRLGAEPRGYLAYNSLLVGMDGASRSRMGELGFVDWSEPLQPYYKVSPALQLRLAQGGEVLALAMLWSPRLLPQALEALKTMPVEVLTAESDAWCALIAMRMPLASLDEVAALAAVEWVELCGGGTSAGAVEEGAAMAVPAGAAASDGAKTVALADSGLGTGGMQGLPGPLRDAVNSLQSYRGDGGEDTNGHGTAVAGVLAEALGAGADLRVYATTYGMERYPRPLSIYSLLDEAYGQGARVFLAGAVPEGRESLGSYGIHASQRDAFAWSNPDMAVAEPAGNEGTDADGDGAVDGGSLLGGATAKNVLSLGGSESPQADPSAGAPLSYGELQEYFSGSFASSVLAGDASAGAAAGMAAFSSRGPTADGRIKPDLVASSTDVPSVASGGPRAAPGVFPDGAAGGVRLYGTSAAAAQAAAALAELRGALTRARGGEPSAALCKALLVNAAEDLSPGQYGEEKMEVPPAPNPVEGWGRLRADRAMDERTWLKILDDEEGVRTGDARVYRVEVSAASELRVTLAWTDYPSLPEARLHLVNDLDLRVVDPGGGFYYPNGRNSRDPVNNMERVVVDVAERPGDYTIEISAWNVPYSPQPFALVVQAL